MKLRLSDKIKNLVSLVKNHTSLLLLLLLFTFISRYLLVFEGIIPFSFDHGKDSLAILHMFKTRIPSLIGPWTSIPGLFFGPGWYYLLLPFFILGGFSPVSAVWPMVLLLLIQVFLMYRYLSKWGALIVSTAPYWFTISTSAWNPFPMSLISMVLMILLHKLRCDKNNSAKLFFWLGVGVSLGFHFSSAYAIFYPSIILFVLIIWKIKFWSLRKLLAMTGGFILPFVPQLLFELRHDFVQTNAIISYFLSPKVSTAPTFLHNFLLIVKNTWGEISLSFLPEIRGLPSAITAYTQLFLSIFTVLLAVKNRVWQTSKIRDAMVMVIAFVIIPLIGFQFLHFNIWYLVGMMPAAVYLVAQIIKTMPKWLKLSWASVLIVGAVSIVLNFHVIDKFEHRDNWVFMPVKIQAINTIRTIADDRPFSSYHYSRYLYDFSYQYLYLADSFQGKQLPVEFAYEPGVVPYVTQKAALLDVLNDSVSTQQEAELIFYIVEEPENEEFLEQWWDRQQFSQIIQEISLSDSVKLFVAEP